MFDALNYPMISITTLFSIKLLRSLFKEILNNYIDQHNHTIGNIPKDINNKMDIRKILNPTPSTSSTPGPSNPLGRGDPVNATPNQTGNSHNTTNINASENTETSSNNNTNSNKPLFSVLGGKYLVEDPQNTAIRGYFNPATNQRYSFFDPVFITSIHDALEHDAKTRLSQGESPISPMPLEKFDHYTRIFIEDCLRDMHGLRSITPMVYNSFVFRKTFLTLKD